MEATTLPSLNPSFSWVVDQFEVMIKKEQETAIAIPAIKVLTEVIRVSQATTIMGLQKELEDATNQLKICSLNTSISLSSVCDLFIRFVTRTSLDFPNFDLCKTTLIERGEQLSTKSSMSRNKISQLSDRFIRDGVTILVHGFSRVVLSVLLNAAFQGKRFSVLVTESRPDSSGYKTATRLQSAKIPVKLIMDGGVSRVIDKVDYVLCGAEAIVENGGIVNKIGTYQISIVAKAFKKPFYVAAESFKFTRSYPLNQSDIEILKKDDLDFKVCKNCSKCENPDLLTIDSPTLDYTPPSYITLLFTELGVLTPSAFKYGNKIVLYRYLKQDCKDLDRIYTIPNFNVISDLGNIKLDCDLELGSCQIGYPVTHPPEYKETLPLNQCYYSQSVNYSYMTRFEKLDYHENDFCIVAESDSGECSYVYLVVLFPKGKCLRTLKVICGFNDFRMEDCGDALNNNSFVSYAEPYACYYHRSFSNFFTVNYFEFPERFRPKTSSSTRPLINLCETHIPCTLDKQQKLNILIKDSVDIMTLIVTGNVYINTENDTDKSITIRDQFILDDSSSFEMNFQSRMNIVTIQNSSIMVFNGDVVIDGPLSVTGVDSQFILNSNGTINGDSNFYNTPKFTGPKGDQPTTIQFGRVNFYNGSIAQFNRLVLQKQAYFDGLNRIDVVYIHNQTTFGSRSTNTIENGLFQSLIVEGNSVNINFSNYSSTDIKSLDSTTIYNMVLGSQASVKFSVKKNLTLHHIVSTTNDSSIVFNGCDSVSIKGSRIGTIQFSEEPSSISLRGQNTIFSIELVTTTSKQVPSPNTTLNIYDSSQILYYLSTINLMGSGSIVNFSPTFLSSFQVGNGIYLNSGSSLIASNAFITSNIHVRSNSTFIVDHVSVYGQVYHYSEGILELVRTDGDFDYYNTLIMDYLDQQSGSITNIHLNSNSDRYLFRIEQNSNLSGIVNVFLNSSKLQPFVGQTYELFFNNQYPFQQGNPNISIFDTYPENTFDLAPVKIINDNYSIQLIVGVPKGNLLAPWKIALIVIGSLAVGAISGTAIYFIFFKNNKRKDYLSINNNNNSNNNPKPV
eukprot:gene2034-2503_t